MNIQAWEMALWKWVPSGCYSMVSMEICSWHRDTGRHCFSLLESPKVMTCLWLWFLPTTINTIPGPYCKVSINPWWTAVLQLWFIYQLFRSVHLSPACQHRLSCKLPCTSVISPASSLGESPSGVTDENGSPGAWGRKTPARCTSTLASLPYAQGRA